MRKDVAKEFRVTPSVVSFWVRKYKQEGHLQQLIQAEEQDEVKLQVVKTMVECILLEDKIIDSAESVAKRIQEEIEVEISAQYIRAVMSRVMGMRYRKIIKASYHANSNQNLILRQ